MLYFIIILFVAEITALNKKRLLYHTFCPSHSSSLTFLLLLMPNIGWLLCGIKKWRPRPGPSLNFQWVAFDAPNKGTECGEHEPDGSHPVNAHGESWSQDLGALLSYPWRDVFLWLCFVVWESLATLVVESLHQPMLNGQLLCAHTTKSAPKDLRCKCRSHTIAICRCGTHVDKLAQISFWLIPSAQKGY